MITKLLYIKCSSAVALSPQALTCIVWSFLQCRRGWPRGGARPEPRRHAGLHQRNRRHRSDAGAVRASHSNAQQPRSFHSGSRLPTNNLFHFTCDVNRPVFFLLWRTSVHTRCTKTRFSNTHGWTSAVATPLRPVRVLTVPFCITFKPYNAYNTSFHSFRF